MKTTLGLGLSCKDDWAMLTYKDTLAQITNDWLQQFQYSRSYQSSAYRQFLFIVGTTQGDC